MNVEAMNIGDLIEAVAAGKPVTIFGVRYVPDARQPHKAIVRVAAIRDDSEPFAGLEITYADDTVRRIWGYDRLQEFVDTLRRNE
jgi:hypothetical protein